MFVGSTPEGADVYVDGDYQGTSPVTVSAISVGSHQVELHLAGYEVLTTTEYVSAGQGSNVNLALTPYSTSSADGSIDISSNLPGAVVYLDGIYKGSTQSGNIFNIIAVSPGSHTLLLHLPGYNDFTQTVEIQAGLISNVYAVFTLPLAGLQSPPSSSPAMGSIIVSSTPADGQVSVDNQFRGVTPVTIYNVAQGSHIVNVQLAGYSNWSTSVDVAANQVVQVPAALSTASGTPPVTTRAGLSMDIIFGALAIASIIASRVRK